MDIQFRTDVERVLQQGDVIFAKISNLPINLKSRKVESKGGQTLNGERYIIAEGETTGHAHCVQAQPGIELFENSDGTLYLKIADGKEAEVVHEEHGHFAIPKGIWEVGIVREYDHLEDEIRKVQD